MSPRNAPLSGPGATTDESVDRPITRALDPDYGWPGRRFYNLDYNSRLLASSPTDPCLHPCSSDAVSPSVLPKNSPYRFKSPPLFPMS